MREKRWVCVKEKENKSVFIEQSKSAKSEHKEMRLIKAVRK